MVTLALSPVILLPPSCQHSSLWAGCQGSSIINGLLTRTGQWWMMLHVHIIWHYLVRMDDTVCISVWLSLLCVYVFMSSANVQIAQGIIIKVSLSVCVSLFVFLCVSLSVLLILSVCVHVCVVNSHQWGSKHHIPSYVVFGDRRVCARIRTPWPTLGKCPHSEDIRADLDLHVGWCVLLCRQSRCQGHSYRLHIFTTD